MKRLSSILSTMAVISMLTACSNQDLNTAVLPVQENQNQTVSAQSVQGYKAFSNLLTEVAFKTVDKNGDGFVSYEEFSAARPGAAQLSGIELQSEDAGDNLIAPAPTTTAGDAPTPAPAPSVAPKPHKPAVVKTLFQIFVSMNKKHDGKLSLAEAKASKYFLGLNRSDLAKATIAPMFAKLDADKNKSISRDEFLKGIATQSPEEQTLLNSLFFASDKNKNNALTVSEFEDLLFAANAGKLVTPVAPPAPPAPVDPNPAPTSPNNTPGNKPQPAPTIDPASPNNTPGNKPLQ